MRIHHRQKFPILHKRKMFDHNLLSPLFPKFLGEKFFQLFHFIRSRHALVKEQHPGVLVSPFSRHELSNQILSVSRNLRGIPLVLRQYDVGVNSNPHSYITSGFEIPSKSNVLPSTARAANTSCSR